MIRKWFHRLLTSDVCLSACGLGGREASSGKQNPSRSAANRYVQILDPSIAIVGPRYISRRFWFTNVQRTCKIQARASVVGCNDAVYRRASLRDGRNIDRGRIEFFRTVRVRETTVDARYVVVATATNCAKAIGFHSDCVDAINALLITRHRRSDFDTEMSRSFNAVSMAVLSPIE